MLRRIFASAIVTSCLMVFANSATAQNSSDQFRPFNGFFANMFDDHSNPPPSQPRQVQHYYNYSSDAPPPKPVPTRAPLQPLPAPPSDGGPTSPDSSSQNAPTGKNYSFQFDNGVSARGAIASPASPGPSVASDAATSYPGPVAVNSLPLHERLKIFRQSPFSDTAQSARAESGPAPSPAPSPAPAEATPPRPAETAAIAQQAPPDVPQAPLAAPPAEAPANPPAAEPHRLETAKAADAGQEPSVLMNHKSPMLSVETIGPRKIVVGKEAPYEVLLQNSGDVAAEEVSVTLGLPEWAEIALSSASSGEVHPASQDHREPCRWVLGRIEAHSKEKLALKIIPKQSKPFELAVRWDFKQVPTEAMIEVQEPKLTMRLDGPREVVFGKRELFKLKLGNSGNGAADNVLLTLMPLNSNDKRPITHRLGTINPGDERSIEIELTARQAGNITISVAASSDGGSHVDLAEHILVHRGALQVDVEGPAVQYVGTPARFRMRVRNSGDAPARNVHLTAKLPTGVKFASGTKDAVVETADDGCRVGWTISLLQPGEQQSIEMNCTLALSGPNHIVIASAADDDLVATAEAVTRVEAMADLRLDVKDPDGPVPVGAEATYELHLRNRGTKAAENVEVLAYFSSGVEPLSAEGQRNRLAPGQVVFDAIPAVAPATEIVFKIRAKAAAAGNHVFRAEVRCKATGTRLVREEVTHYYQDGPTMQASNPPVAEPVPTPEPGPTSAAEPAPLDGPRTAEREAPLPLPQSSGSPTRAIRR
jgi:uncharacterized repeat protein (TIGR01451 family)